MKTVWTAPAEVDMGAVEITGLLTQVDFEQLRQMQLRITKNSSVEPILTVNADFDDQRAIVPLPATQVSIQPGDTLTITVDGSGSLGNGTATFASWDVTIEEVAPLIDADFNGDSNVDGADLVIWQAGFGAVGTATRADGDADNDKNVTGNDFLIWQRQFDELAAAV